MSTLYSEHTVQCAHCTVCTLYSVHTVQCAHCPKALPKLLQTLPQALPEPPRALPELQTLPKLPQDLPEPPLGWTWARVVWGRSWARFDCKNMWFSHNLELVTDATDATDATEPGGEGEVVSRPATRTPHPTRTGGQDDGSYTNSLK